MGCKLLLLLPNSWWSVCDDVDIWIETRDDGSYQPPAASRVLSHGYHLDSLWYREYFIISNHPQHNKHTQTPFSPYIYPEDPLGWWVSSWIPRMFHASCLALHFARILTPRFSCPTLTCLVNVLCGERKIIHSEILVEEWDRQLQKCSPLTTPGFF